MTTQDQVGILTQTNKPASKTNARREEGRQGGRGREREVGGGREGGREGGRKGGREGGGRGGRERIGGGKGNSDTMAKQVHNMCG